MKIKNFIYFILFVLIGIVITVLQFFGDPLQDEIPDHIKDQPASEE